METKVFLTINKLRIYFPWDDDLYTYLKDKNLNNFLPLISSENTDITLNQKSSKRTNVILPESFGESFITLNWEESLPRDAPLIPAEKPLAEVSSKNNLIFLEVIPNPEGREEYHLEHSSRGGAMARNVDWAMMYFSFIDVWDKINKLCSNKLLDNTNSADLFLKVNREMKENQEEIMYYVQTSILYYEFSLGGFKYASTYIKNNSSVRDDIPSLIYDNKLPQSIIHPIAKIGIIKNKEDIDFKLDSLQFVIKLAQPKETISKRGKRAKLRGIVTPANNKNMVIFDQELFIQAINKLNAFIEEDKKN